jgi:hypothetical protein
MTGKELFEAWAPVDDVWSPWVKPVIFSEISWVNEDIPVESVLGELNIAYGVGFRPDTAVIVDLPGVESLKAGYVLSMGGYRPVPLYNTTSGVGQKLNTAVSMAIDMSELVRMLSVLPPQFAVVATARSGTPAFLLDQRRLKGGIKPLPGTYDNRWMVFPQDFPSANFLKMRGITQCIVLQESNSQPQDDLAHVLLRYQEDGIRIFVQDTTSSYGPTSIKVYRPSRFRWAAYRALALMGLRRNSAGGFGAIVPVPGEGGSFG